MTTRGRRGSLDFLMAVAFTLSLISWMGDSTTVQKWIQWGPDGGEGAVPLNIRIGSNPPLQCSSMYLLTPFPFLAGVVVPQRYLFLPPLKAQV